MARLYGLILSLVLSQGIYAQVTVHILNPWRDDTCAGHRDSLLLQGEPDAGLNWSPGKTISSEGGGWFFYIFPRKELFVSRLATFCGPETWQGWAEYQLDFRLDTIFSRFSSSTKDIWIVIPELTARMIITDKPPLGCKYIYFLSPWPIGTPQIIIEGFGAPRMRMDTSITRCGWFKYPYYGIPDSAQVKFMNSLDSTLFSGIGLGDGPFIDLSTVFETSDTAWILPTPHPDGAATVHSSYPGQSLPCNRTLLLATTLRDWDTTHPDVGVGETKRGCGADQSYNEITSGMVRSQLDANGKPVLGNSTCPVDRFNWFTTEMVTGQYTNAMCYNLKLTKNDEGLFEYDTNYFFPADSFRYLDPEGTIPNPRYGGGQDNNGNPHNYYFTMELSAQFDYTKGQTFYFRGDDDVWVFINNRLVVDIGGIHNPCEGAVNLDTLGLTVGNTYSFKGFFVERNCCGSNFRMVTSINLRTTSSLFTTVTVVSPTTKQYDMYEKISKNNLSCDLGETVIDTEKAIVEFYIEGPPFPPEPPTGLPIGTSYGGITIVNNSTVIIDTSTMTGLPPGDYLIRYHLSRDHSQGGTIPFSVTALPPDHLDILVDTIPMDLEKDAVVDSVVIGMLDSSAEAYAVIRDADQTYLNHATDPVWTVRDSTVVTVARSAASPSRCILTKVNEGNTWLVVNHAPGLKPDSVLVIAYVQPPYPIIVSGVMCDNNADLVPDMLYLTLSDTFQTDQRLDSVRIDYRGLTITVPVASVTLRGTQLDVPLPENMGIDGRPEGTAALFMTVSGEVKNNSRAFTDGVSPAIIAADVLESDGSDYDVLFITLSEPIVTGTIIGRQLLLIPQGTADTTALTVIQILAPINDSTFTVQVAPSERDLRVHVGDRLRLIPESDGGTLSDRKKNMPHDLNRSVVIGFRPGAASIAGAWYLDVNADGIIDQLMVKFMRKVEQSEIDTVSVRRNLSSFRIPFSRCTRVSDSIYMIPVGDSIARLNAISTGGPMHVTVGYPAFPGIYRNSTAADSAAPVIVSAMLLPGSLTAADVRDNDILIVTFSEGVARLGRSPFLLSAKKDGQRYSFSLEYLDEEGSASYSYRFKVLSITPSLLFASAGDTIWIDPAAGVSDSGGVAQLNPLNRRVLLQVDWPQAQWNIRISSNPFTRNTPITGQTFGTGVGTAIVLIPTAPVDETRVRATITIYDPVGTVVKQADFTPFNNGFRMVWRGENRKGRYVGSGTYLAFIRVDDGTNRGFIRTMKIGFTQ